MSSGGTAGVVSMKAASVFAQSGSHIPTQHAQTTANLQTSNVLQPPPNGFSQHMQQQQQQQHFLQQQQHQRAQMQHTQQLHRISQPHSLPSVHPTQTAVIGNSTHPGVFPNAEFFQTLQQTAAAALPTVLPYDQSQYIGPLMYFPYPTANGLFAPSSVSDSQQNVGSSASVAGLNPTSSNNSNHILASAAPSAMVTLNHPNPSGQIPCSSHLLTSGSGIVGLGNNPISASMTTPGLASASLAPLFTTAQFYPAQPPHDPTGQTQIHLQHALQPQHTHALQMTHQLHPLSVHSALHMQPSSTTAVLLPGQIHHSTLAQINAVSSQSPMNQRLLNSSSSSNGNGGLANATIQTNSGSSNFDVISKNEEPTHSTPSHTPVKPTESEMTGQTSQLANQSQNSNNGLDVSSSSTKRDNTGTGHFVCTVCGREFGMRCRLIAHTRRHTGERPFPCADCGRAFSDRGNLQRHRYTHSSQPRFHCSVCGKSFRQASCLSNHRRFHCAGATGRPCPFCQRSFRSSSSLQMHIRWKHRADAAAAVAAATAAAAAAAGNSESFTYHLPGFTSYMPTVSMNGIPGMALNGDGDRVHHLFIQGSLDLQGSSLLSAAAAVAASAAIVNNGCLSSSSVTSMLSTIGVNDTVSNVSTTMTSALNTPIVSCSTVTGSPNKRKWRRKQKPKQNAFGRLTGDGMNILAGINLTEGIDVNAAAAAAGAAAAAVGGPVPLDRKGRPCNFPCPACPRRFAFQCRLAAHLRCHTNIRPFICVDCGRAFTQRGYLVRHAAVHKLDRPFSCGLCDRSYKHYGSLVNHKRTHSKLGSSTLSNLALISTAGMDHLNCDSSLTPVAGLSSLEEVVSGRVSKADGQGVTSTSTTTITLLPVTKVEEILPGDITGSVQQICLPSLSCPSANLLTIPDRHLTESDSHTQTQPLPHQLTATAVWPILASQHPGAAQGQMPSQIASAHHFPTFTIPHQMGTQSVGQPNAPQHQLSVLSAQRQQQQLVRSTTMPIMSSTTTTPAFVTVPIFGNHTQLEANDASGSVPVSNSHHPHHPFHGTGPLVSTPSAPDSSQVSHPHHQQQSQPLSQATHHQTSAQQSTPSGDVCTTSMLHVLQPSPSIFFSPYYLPHSATSQM